ncbi:MAG: hydroxymethylglutaryl-CoA synthase family protein [Clostridia bacterium]|nr:hydroxymethylglutaryl-CoA synthase family protein [Clostridia bacterium]
MEIGIEAINIFAGRAFMDVRDIFKNRDLELERFQNLMMEKKSVGLPCEDPVTNAVNAAKPIIDNMTEADKKSIDLLITCSESGVDFGKSLSTYVHDYLGLSRNCRVFEVKQACYAGTAALHMACAYVRANAFNSRALVIATDIARAAAKHTYAEPSQGVGAVAMLISRNPEVMELDYGANGYYSYEVMDTCRPLPEIETGDPDLSLLSYLDCLENSFKAYCDRVDGVDFRESFDYLTFHTPFAGMVKGAHRKLIRSLMKVSADEIETDFQKRVGPSLKYCVQVGNVYSATLYLALASMIDNAQIDNAKRIGLFSYGSGCCSEFYSGIVTPASKAKTAKMDMARHLSDRHALSIEEYDRLLDLNMEWTFGVRDKEMNFNAFSKIYERYMEGRKLLALKRIGKDWHREYIWT